MKFFRRVCVLYGGTSDERPISIKSGKAVYQALLSVQIPTIALDARGSFLKRIKQYQPDMVFVALHGQGGEDGLIQQKLQRADIPFVGSDARSSRNAFDKVLSKRIFKRHRIPTPAWRQVTLRNLNAALPKITLPTVIKPTRNGSSIGIELIDARDQLAKKIRKSIKQFKTIILEDRIIGREFTVGILGKQALPVIELKPKRQFYDYKAKYTKGMTRYLVPAPISKQAAGRLQILALKTHRALGLSDFSRVDMMVDRQGRPYVLEANSIPGFTEFSLLPKAAQLAGISFSELCQTLLKLAAQRYKNSKKI
ncbi:MAG: D-alanine--D-alanine ligase [Candidatus Omnitrophica bacterium CG11_big_fil_rev_8_21_14_0_20_45_26]|uniref:D-alanine--D-alanine ligase n=1 Tax=Candidatus Abzuiibacterium crystallinum TaxID=1974748 RepID=A0A2H0LPI2_9BACT|nr:MAG: D-alanine--D-alanine ligase [Candidatus Omnitrophica bacterium CG11_big_fil_rev_8_21_14_0_20_45_26]PIW64312.1 MAG: D-alanine--D-alanine ligase [Candidatus Omnitrophica bacterium CG12_big_fil_rev_8_21_14_0_65_45_16]